MRRLMAIATVVVALCATAFLSVAASPARADASGGVYTARQGRLADSRIGSGGLSTSPLSEGSVYLVPVAGVNGIPNVVQSVSVTVTVRGATSSGTVLMGASHGTSTPVSGLGSYTLFNPANTSSDTAIVPVGSDGKIALSLSAGNADVLVDAQGYFTAAATQQRERSLPSPARAWRTPASTTASTDQPQLVALPL